MPDRSLASARMRLEIKFYSKLNLPRRHDRRLRERGSPGSVAVFIYIAEKPRGYLADVEVIDAVETLHTELRVQPLRDLRVLGDGNVRAERARTGDTVSLNIPQEPGRLGLIARGIEPLDRLLRQSGNPLLDEAVTLAASGCVAIVWS